MRATAKRGSSAPPMREIMRTTEKRLQSRLHTYRRFIITGQSTGDNTKVQGYFTGEGPNPNGGDIAIAAGFSTTIVGAPGGPHEGDECLGVMTQEGNFILLGISGTVAVTGERGGSAGPVFAGTGSDVGVQLLGGSAANGAIVATIEGAQGYLSANDLSVSASPGGELHFNFDSVQAALTGTGSGATVTLLSSPPDWLFHAPTNPQSGACILYGGANGTEGPFEILSFGGGGNTTVTLNTSPTFTDHSFIALAPGTHQFYIGQTTVAQMGYCIGATRDRGVHVQGALAVNGRNAVTCGTAPTVTYGAAAGTSPPSTPSRTTGSNDVTGTIMFGTGTGSLVAGTYLTVTFGNANLHNANYVVSLTWGNGNAPNIAPAVTNTSGTAFDVYLPAGLTASQTATHYLLNYRVDDLS